MPHVEAFICLALLLVLMLALGFGMGFMFGMESCIKKLRR